MLRSIGGANKGRLIILGRLPVYSNGASFATLSRRLNASAHGDSHGDGHGKSEVVERKSDDYRPGSDSYAYENPWPKLNKGRLDWLFQDGWRRPLASDQGGKIRRQWLWYGQVAHDEHADWLNFHKLTFIAFTMFLTWMTFIAVFCHPDWPTAKEWGLREAHFEIERRQKAGLPLISKDFIDPKRVAQTLPSEEELRDFEILI